jgi:hypothetical protein
MSIRLIALLICLLVATPAHAVVMVGFGGGDPNACGSLTNMGYTGTTDADVVVTSAEPRSFIYTATCSGNLVNAFLQHIGAAVDTAKVCVYLDDGDSVRESADTLVACSGVITSTSTPGWFSAAFGSGALVNGSKYYLVAAPNTTDWEGRKLFAGIPDGYYCNTSYYAGPANMGTGTWAVYETGAEIAMYITYQ